MGGHIGIEIVLGGQGQLEHHFRALGQTVELAQDFLFQQRLGLGLGGGVDVDLGLHDRDQPGGNHLARKVELLLDHGADAVAVGLVDDRAFLGPEDALFGSRAQRGGKAGDGVHQLHGARPLGQPLVDLEERHHAAFVPDVVGHLPAIHAFAQGAFEQDGTDDLVAVEIGGLHDPGAHLLDFGEHRLFAVIVGGLHPVERQRLRGRAAALVQGGDEPPAAGNAIAFFRIGHAEIPVLPSHCRTLIRARAEVMVDC